MADTAVLTRSNWWKWTYPLSAEVYKEPQKAASWCQGCSHTSVTDIITLWKVNITNAPFTGGCIYIFKAFVQSKSRIFTLHSAFAASWIRLRSTLLNNLIVIRSIRHAGKGAKWGLRSARSSSDEGGSRSGESESVFDQFVFSLWNSDRLYVTRQLCVVAMASISDTLLQRLHDLGGTVTSESNTHTHSHTHTHTV